MSPRQIRKLRTRLGFTQAELARCLGLHSYEWISKLENGKGKISTRMMKSLQMLDQNNSQLFLENVTDK